MVVTFKFLHAFYTGNTRDKSRDSTVEIFIPKETMVVTFKFLHAFYTGKQFNSIASGYNPEKEDDQDDVEVAINLLKITL